MCPPCPLPLMDPLRLEALDNHDNQPATGATKAGGGWQEGINEATRRPQRWATTYDKSVWRMMMAVTKRARMARVRVTAMRVPVDKDGKGSTGHGVGNKGGMQQRVRWQQQQEQWRQGWWMSDGNEGNGDRRQTTINQQQDRQRRAVAGKRAPTRQPHNLDGGQQRTTIACGG
jgi:hypothetical protein